MVFGKKQLCWTADYALKWRRNPGFMVCTGFGDFFGFCKARRYDGASYWNNSRKYCSLHAITSYSRFPLIYNLILKKSWWLSCWKIYPNAEVLELLTSSTYSDSIILSCLIYFSYEDSWSSVPGSSTSLVETEKT